MTDDARKMKKVLLHNQYSYEEEPFKFDGQLPEVFGAAKIALERLLEQGRKEYPALQMDDLHLEFDTSSESGFELNVSYKRPETDMELNQRLNRQADWDARRKQREIEELNRLRAKYPEA